MSNVAVSFSWLNLGDDLYSRLVSATFLSFTRAVRSFIFLLVTWPNTFFLVSSYILSNWISEFFLRCLFRRFTSSFYIYKGHSNSKCMMCLYTTCLSDSLDFLLSLRVVILQEKGYFCICRVLSSFFLLWLLYFSFLIIESKQQTNQQSLSLFLVYSLSHSFVLSSVSNLNIKRKKATKQ